jgi:hypothetical protein
MKRIRVLRYALQELRAMGDEPGFDPNDLLGVGEVLMDRVDERMGHRWSKGEWKWWFDFLMKWLPKLLSIALIFLDEEEGGDDEE